ncbi:MAG: hypothetical protein P8X68_14315 [Desulfobacterales bacterium]|jgi:hypothetical protein
MKKFNPKDIGYYGKPITQLTRDELLNVIAELAGIIHECSIKDVKIKELLYVKKNKNYKK